MIISWVWLPRDVLYCAVDSGLDFECFGLCCPPIFIVYDVSRESYLNKQDRIPAF